MSEPMSVVPPPSGLARLFGWQRLLFTMGVSVALALALSPIWQTPTLSLVGRSMAVGLGALLAFGLFEQWPRQLPWWLARWTLQLVGVMLAVPLGVLLAYMINTPAGGPPFWEHPARFRGFVTLSMTGLMLAPWMALTALLRRRDAEARQQELSFALEKSELERQALDARLKLLQAQVEPHFLFNTLANVRAMVDAGSPQASAMLGSLIAYLRAAVPRLHQRTTTLGQELQLVRAYLDLMHLRMPDRLQFALDVDPAALPMRCPPMTLLSLVENAVRHGIDPSEVGGRIDIAVRCDGQRCMARVVDTGLGMRPVAGTDLVSGPHGLGTGLPSLRERLELAFRGQAQLSLSAVHPHGVCAEVDFPAEPHVDADAAVAPA